VLNAAEIDKAEFQKPEAIASNGRAFVHDMTLEHMFAERPGDRNDFIRW
jgi:hypothetical protein